MRTKNEHRYMIRQLANYLDMTIYQLTKGYMDASQMRKASYKDLKIMWQVLQMNYPNEIFAMQNEE